MAKIVKILKNRIGIAAHQREAYHLPSANVTQPDQAFTLQDLMEGFVVGRVPNVARNVDYDLDPETVNGRQIPLMSLSEVEAHAKAVHERLEVCKQRYANLLEQQRRASALEKQKLADLEAAVKATKQPAAAE